MISEEIQRIHEALPSGVRLVAVSKYHPSEAIREAYAAGQRVFGESHAQELQRKHQELADLGLEWHFIGHLQTNKVKYIAPYVHLIHAVDSLHLLSEINKQALKSAGIMAMATNTDNTFRIREDFHQARRFFEEARKDFFQESNHFRELSMGMSDDWHIAVDEGSTLIRIGTQIFGQRQY